MTDSHPFFRLVWRVNALLIFGAAAMVALVVAYYAGRELLRGRLAYRAPERGLETPLPSPAGTPDASAQDVLHVGTFIRGAGGTVFIAPVYSGPPGDRYKYVSSAKGGSERVRNMMLFDSATGAVSRLFPDDKGRILDENEVLRARAGTTMHRTLARVYVYVASDTNGDGRLDAADRQRIVIVRPDGSRPITLAEGVDRYVAASPSEGRETTLSYFLRRGGDLQYGEFDLESFEAGRTTAVKVPPA